LGPLRKSVEEAVVVVVFRELAVVVNMHPCLFVIGRVTKNGYFKILHLLLKKQ
jgi:hypothetical protein